MKQLRGWFCLILCLVLLIGAALATTLPEDGVLSFGAAAWDTEATGTITYDTSAAQPGGKPNISKGAIPVNLAASLLFYAPDSAALADISNPADSGVNLRYTLTITPEALKAGSGLEVDARQILFQSGLIGPGQNRKEITLNPLSDGTPLPQGEYSVEMLVETFDAQTNLRSAGGMTVEIPLTVLVDCRRAEVDKKGTARIRVYNGGGEKAAYALAFNREEYMLATNGPAPEGNVRYQSCLMPLGEIEAGTWADLSAEIGGPVPVNGETIHAWLMRSTGDETKCISRVEIPIAAIADMVPQFRENLDVAQEIVNADYCLQQTAEHVVQPTNPSGAPPADRDANALPADEDVYLGRAMPISFDWATLWLTPALKPGESWDFLLVNPADSNVCILADLRTPEGTLLYRTGLLDSGMMLNGLQMPLESEELLEDEIYLTLYACAPDSYVSLGATEIVLKIEEE